MAFHNLRTLPLSSGGTSVVHKPGVSAVWSTLRGILQVIKLKCLYPRSCSYTPLITLVTRACAVRCPGSLPVSSCHLHKRASEQYSIFLSGCTYIFITKTYTSNDTPDYFRTSSLWCLQDNPAGPGLEWKGIVCRKLWYIKGHPSPEIYKT